jgi:hypothetical protein
MLKLDYDFPVHTEKVFTAKGTEAPKIRAVVREDTGEIIASVSNKYQLIPHAEVVAIANQFMEAFGLPETKHYVAHNGAVMIGCYTFKNQTAAVTVGDQVGMRLYLKNSYNRATSLQLRVGALVLSCLNGAVSNRSIFNIAIRHTGKHAKIEFPFQDRVLEAYGNQVKRWRQFAELPVTREEYSSLINDVWRRGGVNKEQFEVLANQDADNVWHTMQNLTNQITHADQRNELVRVQRLELVSRVIDKHVQMKETAHG